MNFKGWEPLFLIRGIGLCEELIIGFGSFFSNIGLKSQHLGLATKKCDALFQMFFLLLIFIIEKLTTL